MTGLGPIDPPVMHILALNAGSSSVKARLYTRQASTLTLAWKGNVDYQRHRGDAAVRASIPGGASAERTVSIAKPEDAIEPLLELLWGGTTQAVPARDVIHAVGHRVVHGGNEFRASVRVTPEVKRALERVASFAPEHNCLELHAIEAVERLLPPETAQVVVFDTAFHATLPPAAYTYGGPYAWIEQNIRRYGFHGISHQYVSRRAAEVLGRELASLRMVTCHLGNGCSLAAIREGRSVDTTMGFTPLDGLVMGTRSGAVDPGILIHLVRHCGSRAEDLDRILNKESGLQGLSGLSGDMREILDAMAQGNARAQLAFDVYVHRLAAQIAAMIPALGGIDALVFTAGVGENSAAVRRAACESLAFLGIGVDAGRNERPEGDTEISAPDAPVRVLVVRTDEEWEIARECVQVCSSA